MVLLGRSRPAVTFDPLRFRGFSCRSEFAMATAALHKLQQSGFYFGAVTGKQANALLAEHANGTFLIRDSSDNGHLFTLSVRTASGTKNLRIQTDRSSFYLQTDPQSARGVPRFDCVLKLIQFYRSSASFYIRSGAGERVPLELGRPLTSALSTLKHLCRKTVNGNPGVHRDELPSGLREFLQEYDAAI